MTDRTLQTPFRRPSDGGSDGLQTPLRPPSDGVQTPFTHTPHTPHASRALFEGGRGRVLRAELTEGREEYHALEDGELQALLWAATSEHQRRFGDRRTVHLLAYLSQSLPTMAREER